MSNYFDKLNKETRDWNNGISRNISPTDGLKKTTNFDRLNDETRAFKRGVPVSYILNHPIH